MFLKIKVITMAFVEVVHTCTCIHTWTCIHKYVGVIIKMYLYILTHICIHTYMHIGININTLSHKLTTCEFWKTEWNVKYDITSMRFAYHLISD